VLAETVPMDSTLNIKQKNVNLDTLLIQSDPTYNPFLWEDHAADDSSELNKQIQEREFASDPYFMRNIDREEFEEERAFLQFVGEDPSRKRKVWVPFTAKPVPAVDAPSTNESRALQAKEN
jgi:hypothetical protein